MEESKAVWRSIFSTPSDFAFLVGNERFEVDKTFVGDKSVGLKRLMDEDLKRGSSVHRFDDVELKVFHEVMMCIRTDSQTVYEPPLELCWDLLTFNKRYPCSGLSVECQFALSMVVNSGNALQMLKLGDQVSSYIVMNEARNKLTLPLSSGDFKEFSEKTKEWLYERAESDRIAAEGRAREAEETLRITNGNYARHHTDWTPEHISWMNRRHHSCRFC